MGHVLLTPPASEPVSLEDFKSFARLDSSADDSLIGDLLPAARLLFEETTGRATINQTWRLSLDAIPGLVDVWWDGVRDGAISELSRGAAWIELPKAPLVSVTSFTSYSEAGVGTLFTSFYTDLTATPGKLFLNAGATWPAATRNHAAFVIDYVAGYGASGDNVPADIRICIQQIALHWYENRELGTEAMVSKVPMHCERAMQRRKIMRM